MKAKRLTTKDLDKRIVVKLDKSIKKEGADGIMTFGQNNDYPQLIEIAINGSSTAKASAGMYSKFLAGEGFENETINDIVVGMDQRGKDITIKSLLRQVCDSISIHNGFYIHRNTNLENQTGTVHLKPFKDGRFSKPDDTGYSAKLLFYNNWEKDKNLSLYKKDNAVAYNVFSSNKTVTHAQIEKDKKNFKGQVYFQFFDNQYFYPLSPFDASYMDVDSEQQISLYRNRQLRNGFLDKILIRKQKDYEVDEKGDFVVNEHHERVINSDVSDDIVDFLGADGETTMVLEDDVDPDTNEFPKNSFQVEKIEGNVNDKLFENWEKGLANNIRQAPRNIPNLLINVDDGIFSGQSGEAIRQATAFYNAMTRDDRSLISESFREIFSLSDNPKLKDNQNWNIKELELITYENNTDATNADTTTGN